MSGIERVARVSERIAASKDLRPSLWNFVLFHHQFFKRFLLGVHGFGWKGTFQGN